MKKFLTWTIAIALAASCSITADPPAAAQDATAQKQELVDGLHDYTIGALYGPLILKKLITFDMSPEWWARMTDKDQRGLHVLSFTTRDLNEFGKRMGWGDSSEFENSGRGTKEEWKPRIENMLDQWKDKFTLTIKPDTPKCDSMTYDLAMRYFSSLCSFLATSDWKPTSGVANITLVPSATAKDISVVIGNGGKNFTVIAPIETEPTEWDTKMARGFKRGGTNQL